jgi:uncharacterized membrane protein
MQQKTIKINEIIEYSMPIYTVWDYWFDLEKNTYYAIVEKDGELYFSEAIVPNNLKDIKNGE